MTAFSTFTYAKKYFVSPEIEFVTEPDADFGETYKPPQDLINLLADNLIVYDKVGIGTTTPSRALEVIGNALISGVTTFNQDIYLDGPLRDKFRNKGTLGQVLLSDSNSVFWGDVSGVGTPLQTIGIYDEGNFIGTVSNLNFLDGTDQNNLVSATIGLSSSFANIVVSDRWSLSGSDVYRMSKVGIQNSSPTSTLDITGTLHATGVVDFDSTLNVDGTTTLNNTLDVDGATTLNNTLDVIGITTLRNQLIVGGATSIANTLDVDGDVTFNSITESTNKDSGALIAQGGVGIEKNLNVGGNTKLIGTLELDSSLIDINNSTATGKFDYRLASVGTGVSWRPSGVETQNTIWVTKDGNDSNTGLLEGDAKATVGAAASVAEPGDTIVIRPGVYTENNPIGLRTDVTVTGQDLRLVTIRPLNITKDVFHVRRGCLIENVNFAGSSVSIAHTGCGAVAFPSTVPAEYAVSGYIAPGPTTEGPTGRWRSPYIRNCTNFMTGSIGMKVNGDHATASTPGNDLKCMVCDSFTQYNENGIGVSITNNGYAQLVSIFTINCDIGIYADSGGSCDLTNSNSSFGNFGLYAVGIGSTEFTGTVGTYPPTRGQTGVDAGSDIVAFERIGGSRRPYDGQTIFFKINLSNYPDAVGSGVIQAPMVDIQEIVVTNGGSGYSAASPPTVIIRDSSDNSQQPKGPQGIIAELSPTIDEVSGVITAIDIVNSGRNYLSTQNLEVVIDGGSATAEVVTRPIYYAVDSATENSAGISTVTFTEFIPYELFGGEQVSFRRISRILTSSHSFEYIGTGTDINTATPFTGGVPIKANEIVALDGAQIPFTSTDQKGNFDIGEGFQINQPTSTIRGRDFSKAIQAEVTPLILALR